MSFTSSFFSSSSPLSPTARSVKASSTPSKPPTTSSTKGSTSHVPPLSKTEPAVSAVAAASSFKQVDSVSSVTVPPTSTTSASLESEAAETESQTSSEETETVREPVELKTASTFENIEMTSFSAATEEPSLETTTDSPVESSLSPAETLEFKAAVVEGPVEPSVQAQEVQTKETDSGEVFVSHNAKDEHLIETTRDSPGEAANSPETLESEAPVAVGSLEPVIDATGDTSVETKSTNSGLVDILHTATVEPLLDTTVEASTPPLETLERGAAAADCAVEPSVDAPAQAVQTNSTDSANFAQAAEEQLFMETTVDASEETSTSPVETLESIDAVAEASAETEADAAAQAVQTNSTDSGVVNISLSAKEEPLIETTTESAPETRRAAVSEGAVESSREDESADSLSHAALIQNMQESTPLLSKNVEESLIESTAESSENVAVEEEVNRSEKMTLESVTLHTVEVMVESLKTDELFQTKLILDEKAEKELQELLVQTQTGAEYKAAAEPQNSCEDEGETLTAALSKWDSLSEDLQELEGESGALVKELFCHVETSSSCHPPVGANVESLQVEEKRPEEEAMTLESVTLSDVKDAVGGLEAEVLLETRDALEKEAEMVAKEEKMEVKTATEDVAVLEDSTEAEILTLDSISEATEAIEAETSVLLEAMFGSEQGLRPPPDILLVDQKLQQQDEGTDQEAEKESAEQEVSVVEAMTLESVTLAEVEASLGTLANESLSETTDYLEKEAEILAEEERMEVKDMLEAEETTEDVKNESLSLPEGDALSEDLQIDALMEELLFCVPGHVTGITENQEAVRENILDGKFDSCWW